MNDIDLRLPIFDEFYNIELELKTAERGSKKRNELLRRHSSIFDKLYESGNLWDYWEYALNRKESKAV